MIRKVYLHKMQKWSFFSFCAPNSKAMRFELELVIKKKVPFHLLALCAAGNLRWARALHNREGERKISARLHGYFFIAAGADRLFWVAGVLYYSFQQCQQHFHTLFCSMRFSLHLLSFSLPTLHSIFVILIFSLSQKKTSKNPISF